MGERKQQNLQSVVGVGLAIGTGVGTALFVGANNPAWIGIGDIDLFHDEAVDYAQRLDAAGVEVELHVEPGMYHAADAFAPVARSMQQFRDRMVTALGDALSATVDA